ncbi:hypothetical protein INT47_012701 [Mucor saturninus]|uniref:RRM domain-containing protein n=1 Tax=Mucor saturninus TaxID=64648 RepID=A0A8H7V559_9FUNG|nr:hypothetical protein INT47_012701 [Mucor saturninus]
MYSTYQPGLSRLLPPPAPPPAPTNYQSTPSHKTTLWMGELEPWMDEGYIQRLWLNLNAQVAVKVIRDKTTFTSSGYAFVDFGSISAAQCALDMFNGEIIPNTSCTIKLNWASGGGLVDRKEDRQPEYSVFLGDLSSECSEQILLSIFQNRYRSCKSAKIMTDPRTGLTRGYGFVRFSSQLDQHQAMNEMQGFVIGNRPIRVSLATPKTNSTHQHECLSPTTTSSLLISQPLAPPPLIPSHQNTTVFVGGLSCPLQEDELKSYFSIFGEIVYVKIPPGKGCGFVQFVSRQSAEMAIDQMNGYQIGSSRIRLSWGRSQNQPAAAAASPEEITMHGGKMHPFDEDRGFMTVFDQSHYPSYMTNMSSSSTMPDSTTAPLWSSDYHTFAQYI